RRHEKDFILRRDRKYGDEMKIRAGEFTTGLANVDAPEATKTELKQKLADYQRDFFAWMETALKLSGELKAMSESFSLVEPVIEEVSREVNALRTEAERSRVAVHENVQWEMTITVTLIAALVLAAGFFIGRSVSKPLSALTAAMIDLAKGNFSMVLPGLGRHDEIGQMARAVDAFRTKAQEEARDDT